jgi:hypothetical protein
VVRGKKKKLKQKVLAQKSKKNHDFSSFDTFA